MVGGGGGGLQKHGDRSPDDASMFNLGGGVFSVVFFRFFL